MNYAWIWWSISVYLAIGFIIGLFVINAKNFDDELMKARERNIAFHIPIARSKPFWLITSTLLWITMFNGISFKKLKERKIEFSVDIE
jgi:hypothetical protein